MDPLHFCIALGPVAVYGLLLGAINLRRRPFMTTGARDAAALGVAITGFAVVGPIELFLPSAVIEHLDVLAWVLCLAFYGLCLALCVLLMRPRLVIYNVTIEQLRPILASVVADLDKEARWAGDSLVLPKLGVQLHLESFLTLRNTQLVSNGPRQSYLGWKRLETALGGALRDTKNSANPYGYFLLAMGLAIVVAATFWFYHDPEAVTQALNRMLRR